MEGTDKYKRTLTKLIKDENGGKLPAHLMPMANTAARTMAMLDKIERDIDNSELVTIETGASGQAKPVVNPLISLHEKYLGRLQGLLYELGLSNRKAATKAEQSSAEVNPFVDMLDKMGR